MILAAGMGNVGYRYPAAGVSGTVEELGLFTTQMVTSGNRTVITPNAHVAGA